MVTNHFNGESANPAWVVDGTNIRRYAELVGNYLALTVDGGGGQLTISNPHGDIVSTGDAPPSNSAADGIDGWNNFDEFGIAAATNTASTGSTNYGWVGRANEPQPRPEWC
ncbi:hypothetical protein OHB24_20545 [Kribbella sp. NBC_00482]|uniref:hypothetical protein n=1 Tax=Kribbella sp. NBC_00482 TaxID=2975968 RepID=UPI002E191C37